MSDDAEVQPLKRIFVLLEEIKQQLTTIEHRLSLVEVPEPGCVTGPDGEHVLSRSCPISCLQPLLTVRAFNPLRQQWLLGYRSVETVADVLDLDLNRVQGLGRVRIEEIQTVLDHARLKPDPARDLAGGLADLDDTAIDLLDELDYRYHLPPRGPPSGAGPFHRRKECVESGELPRQRLRHREGNQEPPPERTDMNETAEQSYDERVAAKGCTYCEGSLANGYYVVDADAEEGCCDDCRLTRG